MRSGLQFIQQSYKDASRWSIKKIIQLICHFLRPCRRVRRARDPLQPSRGIRRLCLRVRRARYPLQPSWGLRRLCPPPKPWFPKPRLLRFPKHAICACDRKCSYGVSLVLKRVVIPLRPKPRLRRSPQKKKSTYGGNLATGNLGRKVLPAPATRLRGSMAMSPLSQSRRPRLPRRGRPRRKLGQPPQGRLRRSTR